MRVKKQKSVVPRKQIKYVQLFIDFSISTILKVGNKKVCTIQLIMFCFIYFIVTLDSEKTTRFLVCRDIFSVLKNATAFRALQQLFVDHVKTLQGVTVIAALESRGFLFGPALALELGLPFVPIRKKGKLPGKVKQIAFDLEYGSVSMQT